jgi:CRP/FNR family transcriptional regulator
MIPTCCYVVKKGRVISFEYTDSGEERIYNFMEEGSVLLESNVLTDKPVHIYFKTAKPCELVCIEKDELVRAIYADKELMMDVIESISCKFFASMDSMRYVCCHDATWRVCNLLLIFADRFGTFYDGKILIREKINQQTISNLVAINRITAVHIFKKLKELNLVEQIDGFYCIPDVEKLKNYMNAHSDNP